MYALRVGRQTDHKKTACCVRTCAYRAGSHVELERVPPEQMPPAELAARRSRLVFIGRTAGLEATLRQGFEAL
jgi:hypothetical protein